MDFDVSECADGVFVDEQYVPAVRATLFEDDTLRCRFRGDFGEDRKDWPRISTIAPRPTAALLG
ncbi:hypothetical protein [Mycobacteroides abscessus]|uniref:hypothetical protein n=1 Tax=Mycobacteroides abscessus TaxID=36809 RepID=UPI0002E47658|nr:hypothetical protein [Mycobacteroides abscessus]SID18240.1 Uncharacterised protein [Mycobacteroides abscessus subsp. abscessus]SIL97440.1 Uncharacterised protein [Mycobacteroides abscessus subsp. abscessus]SLD47527.1 Uncharacterised protein [Mycobacteroides abscessus subsp. abscessus]